MRPPKSRQSGLKTPLNRILGAEGNVRILRVLSVDAAPMTRTELARRARLEPKGAHLAAERLLKEGIVMRLGEGAVQHVALTDTHPLASAIKALYAAEHERANRVFDGLRDIARSRSGEIDGAWIQGAAAADEDRPGDPITFGVLTRASATATLSRGLREAVTPIETSEDVTVDIKIYTRADLLTMRADEADTLSLAVPLFGPSPRSILEKRAHRPAAKRSPHSRRDAEQRLLAEAIVRHLRRHPSKRRQALHYIEKRWNDASPQERHELQEWKAILEGSSNARLERVLTDPGERSTRLRQTLPFVNLLSREERDRLLAELRDDAR